MAILKIQMRKKSFFHENLLDLTSFSQVLGFFLVFFSSDIFSSGLYFLWSYFLRLYWQPPYYFRKSHRNPKHRTLFPRTWENLDFFPKFLFPGFFPETFIPGTFFHRFKPITFYVQCTVLTRKLWNRKSNLNLNLNYDFK